MLDCTCRTLSKDLKLDSENGPKPKKDKTDKGSKPKSKTKGSKKNKGAPSKKDRQARGSKAPGATPSESVAPATSKRRRKGA